MTAPEVSATDVYALGRDPAESARLRRQSEELRPDSAALLDRVGLGPGQSAIDIGCGPTGILELLAERASPGGRVVGLDADRAHVAMARQFVTDRQLPGVEIVAADARHTGLPSGSFDLVHARTVLVTVPEPTVVVTEMVRLTRPGGWIASLEPDAEYSLCYPAHPGLDPGRRDLSHGLRPNGADLCIGRRLTELYGAAGLEDIGVKRLSAFVPGQRFPPHDPAGPGPQHAPHDPGHGTGRRARAGRARPAGPRASR